MRKTGKSKAIHWFCEGDGRHKCGRAFTTEKISTRRRCECGMFMKRVTAEELDRKRRDRRGRHLLNAVK